MVWLKEPSYKAVEQFELPEITADLTIKNARPTSCSIWLTNGCFWHEGSG